MELSQVKKEGQLRRVGGRGGEIRRQFQRDVKPADDEVQVVGLGPGGVGGGGHQGSAEHSTFVLICQAGDKTVWGLRRHCIVHLNDGGAMG